MLIQKGMNLAQRLHGKKKSFNGWVVERVTRNTNRLVIVMHHIAKELKKENKKWASSTKKEIPVYLVKFSYIS